MREEVIMKVMGYKEKWKRIKRILWERDERGMREKIIVDVIRVKEEWEKILKRDNRESNSDDRWERKMSRRREKKY